VQDGIVQHDWKKKGNGEWTFTTMAFMKWINTLCRFELTEMSA
jgi:hypothetical protein